MFGTKIHNIFFLQAFNNTEVKHTMSHFDNYFKSMQSSVELPIDTDKALKKFNYILHSVCKGSLKIKQAKPIKRNKSSRHKKWFDKDLASMHSELVRKSKLYSNFPNDPIIRGPFFKFRKIYSKCCKQKYKSFRTSIVNKLNSLHDTDPNAYWKLLKDLQDDKQSDQSEKISSEQWVNYFSKLFSIDEKYGPQNKYFEKLLTMSEKSKSFSALDFRITDK